MLQKVEEQSNLEAKRGALKEMISEGWLIHIQQHPTLLKPNWPLRHQIASSSPNTHRDTHRAWHTVEADLFTLNTTLRSYALTTRTVRDS